MKNYLVILFALIACLSNAQTWNTLEPDIDKAGLEENPLKGFATMFNPSPDFPRTIQGKLFGLNEVMNGLGDYNWDVMEDFIQSEAEAGNHVYLQVNIDPGIGETELLGTGVGMSLAPDYLIPLVEWEYFETTPEVLEASGIPYYNCPNWNDPDMMAAILDFIQEFGERYNGDDRIFMISPGLYGMWGEWHIGDVEYVNPGFAMSTENKNLMANAWSQYFSETNLVARYPQYMPDPEKYGYSDGLFFTQSISPTNGFYFDNILKDNGAGENWKLFPIGGEVDPDIQPYVFDDYPIDWTAYPDPADFADPADAPVFDAQDVYECLEAIRPTWLFCHHILANITPTSPEWNHALDVQKALGYTLHVNEYKITAVDRKPALEVNIQNLGLAPMYAKWNAEFAYIDANNEIVSLGQEEWDFSIIQPDTEENYRSLISSVQAPLGTHTFLMRVVNPIEQYTGSLVPFTFANSTQHADALGWLTLGEATITDNPLGEVPVPVEGVNSADTDLIIYLGQTYQLQAEVTPLNATNQNLTWSSDHPSTVTVDESGVVSGVVGGAAIVTAYSQDGAESIQFNVTVSPYTIIPNLIEAENYAEMSGVGTETSGEGTLNVGAIDGGDWMEYAVKVENTAEFELDLRMASQFEGAQVELYDQNSMLLATVPLAGTGAWQTYETRTSTPFILESGEYNFRITSTGGNFNLNWIEFRQLNIIEVTGCTDPLYTEFNPFAVSEDGSCATLVVAGCVYEAADNYNPAANRDDYSCVFTTSCQGDFNLDGAVTVGDLSGFLSVFGTACGE